MFTLGRKKPESGAEVRTLMSDVHAAMDAAQKRQKGLMHDVAIGLSAGGFCLEKGHQVVICNVQRCGCEGLCVLPFAIAFWTCNEFDAARSEVNFFYGWSPVCKHGASMPLPGSEAHDIVMKGEPFH